MKSTMTQSDKDKAARRAAVAAMAPTDITGIGQLADYLLVKGKGVEEVLAGVKRVFPEASTTKKSVYYYATHLGIRLRRGAVADAKALKSLVAELSGTKKARVKKVA